MNSVSSAAATRHLEPYPMYDSGIVPRYRPPHTAAERRLRQRIHSALSPLWFRLVQTPAIIRILLLLAHV